MAHDPRSILVVGPDPDLLDIVSSRLVRLGFRVRQAHSEFEALAYISRQSFGLVILDLNLPPASQRPFLAQLTDPPHQLKVIAIVDSRDASRHAMAVEQGAYRCIPRSRCHHRELDHAVEESLDLPHVPNYLQTADVPL